MTKTFEDILEQLKQLEETTLLEILGLSSEDLVNRCQDLVEDNPEKFERELNQFFDDDEDNENE